MPQNKLKMVERKQVTHTCYIKLYLVIFRLNFRDNICSWFVKLYVWD